MRFHFQPRFMLAALALLLNVRDNVWSADPPKAGSATSPTASRAAPGAPAAAAPGAPAATAPGGLRTREGTVAKPATLDFEGELIEGQKKTPELFFQTEVQKPSLDSVLYQRKDFNDFHTFDRRQRPRLGDTPAQRTGGAAANGKGK